MKRSEVFWVSSGVLKGQELRAVGSTKTLGSVWEANGKITAEAKGRTLGCDFTSREQARRVVEDMVCGG